MPHDARRADWKSAWVADLDRVAARDRWGLALLAVGWVHLTGFLTCQGMYDSGDRREVHYVAAWGLELAAVLFVLRRIAGPGWARSTPLAGLIARVWATFLILSFNLVMLNALTGWESRWYKPAWGTLSTFFLASLAWLFSPRLFIPAVQMYLTALLMVRFREQENLIYGVSWWLALMGIAQRIRRGETEGMTGGLPA